MCSTNERGWSCGHTILFRRDVAVGGIALHNIECVMISIGKAMKFGKLGNKIFDRKRNLQ